MDSNIKTCSTLLKLGNGTLLCRYNFPATYNLSDTVYYENDDISRYIDPHNGIARIF